MRKVIPHNDTKNLTMQQHKSAITKTKTPTKLRERGEKSGNRY